MPRRKFSPIDINTEEDDVVIEKVNQENLSAQEMLNERLKERFWKTAKEEYIDNIIDILALYRGRDDLDRSEMDLYKRALTQIDWIYGIQKNKEPLKVVTKAGTMQDIQQRLKNF